MVGDGADLGARVRYSWEQPRVLGSAGGPRLAQPILGADTFLIINGDTLTDVDLVRLADAHAASGALVTLALVPNREFTRYGGVLLDDDHRVTGFARRGPSSEGSYHYIGVQMVNGVVFDSVPPGEPASSIGGVYDAVIASRPGAVRGFVCDAEFWDVGTVEDYWRTSEAFVAKSGAASSSAGRGGRIDRLRPRHALDSVGRCGRGSRGGHRRVHRDRRRARGRGRVVPARRADRPRRRRRAGRVASSTV